jgi:NAD(P)-dependent dehydrogenase (short-subunit alcohol dehydrogenase family)
VSASSSELVALVTGGASGVGAALCRRLAARGATVVVADVDEAGAAAVAGEIGGAAMAFDVGSRPAWDDALAAVVADHGRLDRLALNAGIMTRPRGLPMDDDPFGWMDRRAELVRSVNIDGVVNGTLAARDLLAAAGGSIAVTASVAGLRPQAEDPAYSASKHAVIGWVRSVARPLAGLGVAIGAVCPGGIDTPLVPPDVRAGGHTFVSPDHIAGALEMVLDLDHAESGSIWISVGTDGPAWRYEFAPLLRPAD